MKAFIKILIALCLFANVSSAQIITTVAGNGKEGFNGDGIPAISAEINKPYSLAFDSADNLYYADFSNRIRKIDKKGMITTVAGDGYQPSIGWGGGNSGDGGQASLAEFTDACGLAFDKLGNMYIVDHYNSCIRKVDKNGIVSTVVGTGISGYSGDGGLANLAQLRQPYDIKFDTRGNLFIADGGNSVIRKVDTNGIITTIAGTGIDGNSGDGNNAISAELFAPIAIDIDAYGNIFIASGNQIRKIDNSGIITTVVGTGIAGYLGDGGQANKAQINNPRGLTIDSAGNLIIIDYFNHRVRKVDKNGIITTIVGNGIQGNGGDNGLATLANLNYPIDAVFDRSGNMYISDLGNNRIRKVTFGSPSPTILSFTPNGTCPNTSIPVFITGANFTGATKVTVGGTAVDSFTVNDSSSITAYISKGTTGKIAVIGPDGTATSDSVFTFGLGHTAYAYIPNVGDSTVSVINTITNKVIATIKIGDMPSGICFTPDGTKGYVTNIQSKRVSVINTVTNLITATIAVGDSPDGMCMSPDGATLYVANNKSNTISVVNTATNVVKATINAGNGPAGICVSPDGAKVYVTNTGDNAANVFNTATNTIIATTAVGHLPTSISISPDGSMVYVTNFNDGTVSIISTATNSVVATVGVGVSPSGSCVNPQGTRVYVANQSSNSVSIINTATNQVIGTIKAGTVPSGLSISPDGTKIYVINSGDNSVTIVNALTDAIEGTVSVGSQPYPLGNFIVNVPTPCAPPPPPTISSFKIAACPNTIDTIRGTGFTGVRAVTFGGIVCKSFTVLNDTTIAAVVDSGASGKLTVTTPNGTASLAGFTYLKPTSSTTTQSICQGSTFTFNGTMYSKAGSYITHLTNSAGCDSAATLVLYIKDTSSSTTNKSICPGKSYTFNGKNYSSAGTYAAHLTNSVGCDSTATLVLTITQPVTFPPIVGDTVVCINDSILLKDVTKGGVWSSQNTSIATVDKASGYVLGLDTGYVTINYNDTAGCSASVSHKVDVLGEPINVYPIPINANCESAGGGSIPFDYIGGKESPYQVAYQGIKYSLPYTFSNLPIGSYSFTIYNRAGCKVETLPNEIIALGARDANCDTLYVPTAFVPLKSGTTGYTTVLKPYGGGISIQTVSFRVYNRYGQLVFETHQLDNGWNGMINGVPQDAGTYVWILNYTPVGRKPMTLKGTSVLIR